MSLPVPLAVRVAGKHVTREVSSFGFRKEAIGGVRSIGFNLSRPLSTSDVDVAHYAAVQISDTRSAEVIAEGKVSDTGRGAGADGERWDVVAFGPLQHASDKTFPYVVVTESQEIFRNAAATTPNATTGTYEYDEETPALVHQAEQGKTAATTWMAESICRTFLECGMKLGRVSCTIYSRVNDTNFQLRLVTRLGAGTGMVAASGPAAPGATYIAGRVVTNFTDGHNVVSVQTVRNTSSITGVENHFFTYYNLHLRAKLMNAAGTELTTGLTVDYVVADMVVNDLLGRVLDQYDGANAFVDLNGNPISNLSYPDGVTAEQVFTDLMALEPAYRWTTGPDLTGNGYSFRWELWPTTVRYEVSLDDGADFPSSAQDLYNEVKVRWRGPAGNIRAVVRTRVCQILTDAGITRTALLDLGDELGNKAQAELAGDNFLAEHNVPRNGGTLTIARPIRDITTGRMVDPHEIEPGELIRVRGVESYPDALNADSNDGQTVFRIWALDYTSESHSARLELDSNPKTEAALLTRLTNERKRRR